MRDRVDVRQDTRTRDERGLLSWWIQKERIQSEGVSIEIEDLVCRWLIFDGEHWWPRLCILPARAPAHSFEFGMRKPSFGKKSRPRQATHIYIYIETTIFTSVSNAPVLSHVPSQPPAPPSFPYPPSSSLAHHRSKAYPTANYQAGYNNYLISTPSSIPNIRPA